MTGGVVVVLGRVGRNFAAGMSGGIAYLLRDGLRTDLINDDSVALVDVEDPDALTRAARAARAPHRQRRRGASAGAPERRSPTRFVQVLPHDLRRAARGRAPRRRR